METRLLDTNDFENYKKLRLTALATDPSVFGSTFDEEKQYNDERFKTRLIVSSNQFIVGSFIGTDLVAMAKFNRFTNIKERHKGEITSVYCLTNYRGRGIARTTLLHLIKQADQIKHLKQLRLTVSSDNVVAKKLYAALGFQKYGIETDSLFDGKYYFDEDLMSLNLKTSDHLN
ncbi:GNAT family N-acetyltransferase [Oenococcus sicerae]|uniref:GNAT family N-acetyltransferase n=1 Tax=Oenococcus sicerae TaxID=2203724 RepID=UPI0039E7B82C